MIVRGLYYTILTSCTSNTSIVVSTGRVGNGKAVLNVCRTLVEADFVELSHVASSRGFFRSNDMYASVGRVRQLL